MHTTEIAVRFHELDPYGHVNHATYLSYFEAARVDALAGAGLALDALQREGLLLVVVEARARFLRPAGLGDRLRVETAVTEVRRASTRWRQRADRDGDRVATVEVRIGLTGAEGRPLALPERMVTALEPLLAPAEP